MGDTLTMKGKSVLVTGGAGFIGANLARTLAKNGNQVVVVDDLSGSKDDLSGGGPVNMDGVKNVTFIEEDILNHNAMEGLFERHKFDVVFHLAASFANQRSIDNPEQDLNINGLGTLRMLQCAQKHKVDRFVYSSSSCIYGATNEAMQEDRKPLPETPYAITKLMGEYYCQFFHEFYKLKTSVVRYFNVYGPLEYPGKYRNVIPNFLYKAMQGQPLPIMGTGNETRDFTFVDDAIAGTILAGEHQDAIGNVFNIGKGEPTTISHLASMVNKVTGNKGGVNHIPRRSWDMISQRLADTKQAEELLGFKAKTPLETGLKRTYEWFEKSVKVSKG